MAFPISLPCHDNDSDNDNDTSHFPLTPLTPLHPPHCTALTSIALPSLLVGTLDSLMNLTDTLTKSDSSVVQVLSKISSLHSTLTDSDSSSVSVLKISGSETKESYLSGFQWSYAKYPHRRPLPDLTNLITSTRSKPVELVSTHEWSDSLSPCLHRRERRKER